MKYYNLLVTEWLKFRKNAVVSLLGIMFLVFMPTSIFIGKEFKNVPPPLPNNSIFFEFPSMWSYLGYVGNWLVFFFIGLMVIYMITSEVGYKTMRQNIISGYTRHDFYMSKMTSTIVLCLFVTFMYAVIGLGIGLWHTEGADLAYAFDNNLAIPRFFLMSLGYCSIGFFIAFLLRRSGIAVMFYLSYVILVEIILRWGVHGKMMGFKNSSINYYPANSFEDLMPNPLFRYAEAIPMDDLDFDFLLTYGQAAISSVIYISIFFGLSYFMFLKRDI
ncbi:MAG: ABC transporter permease subunit [Saprospiraceae bacterium]|nr:ABC transporter permease subunit [Saprospiraceae bacterium]